MPPAGPAKAGRISYAAIRNVQSWSYRLIIAVILVAMLLAGAISYFLSRNIDNGIRRLKKGTEIIAGGDLTHRVTARGKDEIAALAQAFNEMTGRLSVSYASLAAEVREKEKAREDLRIATLYTRSLIEVSLDPLVTISTDGKIMDVNHATELATGIPREQLIGSNFSAYFTDQKKAQEGYKQAFSNGFARDYPLAIRHVSGLNHGGALQRHNVHKRKKRGAGGFCGRPGCYGTSGSPEGPAEVS